MRAWKRAKTLTAREWGLLARAAGWLVVARLGLATVSFDRLQRFVRNVGPARDWRAREREICWAVCATAHRLRGTRCLPRSIALVALLRRAGIDAELRIGVDPSHPRGLRAHAWVESRGVALLDEDITSYRSLGPLAR